MKKLKKVLLPSHHNTLDAPVFVWMKVHETGDLSWLLIKKRKLKKGEEASLSLVFEGMYDEYIKEFGISEYFAAIKNKELEIARLQIQRLKTGDRGLETFIEIAQVELEEMKKEGVKGSLIDTKIAIEREFKYQINLHETSIREFYSYVKHMSKAA